MNADDFSRYYVDGGYLYHSSGKPFPGTYNRINGYMQCSVYNKAINRYKTDYAHRLTWACINGPIPTGMQINHIDGDKRNNHISNLEMVSTSTNNHYVTKPKGLSQYFGCKPPNARRSWMSNISFDGYSYYLGTYRTELETAYAYDVASVHFYGRVRNKVEHLIAPENAAYIKLAVIKKILDKQCTVVKVPRDMKHGYVGVHHTVRGLYHSVITDLVGHTFCMGYYKQAIDAAYACNKANAQLGKQVHNQIDETQVSSDIMPTVSRKLAALAVSGKGRTKC